jgi:heavy metal translocating P-type ATPase
MKPTWITARALALVALLGLVTGLILKSAGHDTAADRSWALVIVLLIVPETLAVLRTLLSGRLGVDSIALLAMATALIMEQYLAGAVVALMLSGGNALEEWAAGRSRRELTALIERAPISAHRLDGGQVEEIPIEAIAVGDVISVRAGEVIPVDGSLLSATASVDEAALTGESLPVEHARGRHLRSGTTNAGNALELRATATAEESSYARLVALVAQAEDDRAPFVRMADRYAVYLLVATLGIAGAAWAVSGESIRFLAVLVVATPCPLILAAPIAFIAGISRAASRGVIVKGGGAIEGLGRAHSVLLDKTGTLTIGHPQLETIVAAGELDETEMLRLAASLEQMSTHVLAQTLVIEAESRELTLSLPTDVSEVPGEGVKGVVEGRAVVVGSSHLLAAAIGVEPPELIGSRAGSAHVFVAVDGRLAGTLLLADQLRDDAYSVPVELHALGVKRVAMLTGDHEQTARYVAGQAGIDEVLADQTAEDKVTAVKHFQSLEDGGPVVMVGDGINDAPALASADVGVAMSTEQATASTEVADVVVTLPEIGRVVEAVAIGRRSYEIALQSVLVGIGLSVVAMGFAAVGMIPPVAGALLQEGIDIAVILNAMRALRPG